MPPQFKRLFGVKRDSKKSDSQMNWRTIKNFGQVKYFNISYAVIILVPILANTFHVLNEKFCYGLIVPDTVKSLYLASFLYAIAIAIYQYRCPAIIKEYVNQQDYIDKNLKQFENKVPDRKLNIVLAHLNKTTQKESYDEIVTLYSKDTLSLTEEERTKHNSALDEKLNTVYSSSVQSHLEKKYNDENKKHCVSLWASGILYIIGTGIIVILLIIRTLIVFNN